MLHFGIEDVRAMVAQYNLGRSDGLMKAQHRDKAGGVMVEFYQEGYDDAVSGLRQNLPKRKAEWVGAAEATTDPERGFALRQVLYGLRRAVESERSGSPASVLAAVNLAGERIMGDREAFFRGSEASPLESGAEPERPGQKGDTIPSPQG